MSRSEIFAKAYPDAEDPAPLFEAEYRVLQEFWDEIPEELRDEVLELPPALKAEEKISPEGAKVGERIRAEHIRIVDQRYRHRMATAFATNLPDIFRRVMQFADDVYIHDLLFFGTMGALSACMPGVQGSYDREVIQPNLFLFITGNAASGKGRIILSRKLLEPLHRNHPSWQFIIPGNSSDTAIYQQLAENQGLGIIFETEADTLSNALGKASGKFGEGLRKAFHNETISFQRRTNDEKVVIDNPALSVVITGTPQQLTRLIPNPEDGLFSRFLFYRLSAEQESFPPQKAIHHGITGEMVNDYIDYLGVMVSDFFDRLCEKAGNSDKGLSIRFSLSEPQETQFQQYFNKAAKDYQQLFLEGYKDEDRAAEAVSIMRRLGNICYRMMMILTVSRLITEEAEAIPDEVVCDQRDFETVLEMEPVLRFHNHCHFDEMLVNNKTILPMELEDADSGDMLNLAQRKFFQQLPVKFIKQEAEQMGLNLSLSKATIKRYLDRYIDLGLLKRIKTGVYEKTGKGVVQSSDQE